MPQQCLCARLASAKFSVHIHRMFATAQCENRVAEFASGCFHGFFVIQSGLFKRAEGICAQYL